MECSVKIFITNHVSSWKFWVHVRNCEYFFLAALSYGINMNYEKDAINK